MRTQPIRSHHQQVIEQLVDIFGSDPNYLALILAGSIAHGYDRPDSDVDIMLVVTDEEYEKRKATNSFAYFNPELCKDWPDGSFGYVDGKIIDTQFLLDAADRGSEPTRWAFEGNQIIFSKLDGMDDLIQRIATYPAEQQIEKMKSFYAQMQALEWYAGEAARLNNRYLLTHVLADMVLYGGRLILAYNKMLYPYHKWFPTVLSEAPLKPDGLMQMIDELLEQPSKDTVQNFCKSIFSFTDWPPIPEGWPTRFMHDTEWTWRNGHVALEDS